MLHCENTIHWKHCTQRTPSDGWSPHSLLQKFHIKKKKTSVNDCMIWRQSLEAGMFSTHKYKQPEWDRGHKEIFGL